MRCLVITLYLLAGVATAPGQEGLAPQEGFTPPAVGQPVDFSRAIGTFRIEANVATHTVAVEEPIELTVTITGQALPGHAPRQGHLRLFPSNIEESFYVESISESAQEGFWKFVYRLRPKSTAVSHIPGLRFAYFALPQRRYQAAYSDAIAIQVKSRPDPKVEISGLKVVIAPPSFFTWATLPGDGAARDDRQFMLSWWTVMLLALVPPLLALAGVQAWRRLHPYGQVAREQRRHRAASQAVAALTANHRPAPEVVAVVTEYCRCRLDFPAAEPTPDEIERWLKRRGVSAELRQRWRRFFEDCDEARYRPAGLSDGWLPATVAVALIQELERDPCVGGRR